MNQIIHIFRKDVRHHWIMILLCQVALVLYCWNQVESWNGHFMVSAEVISSLVHLLLPLTWCFFILRIVQSESLVGDRQFWVTRPYQWTNLLGEKVLLVVVFLNVPILTAGFTLLAKAGFSPAPHVLGLIWMQLLLFLVPFVPLLALAAVTRNLVPAVVTLLVLLFLTVSAALLILYASSDYSGIGFYEFSLGVPRVSGDLESVVLLLACVAAVALQYARRKTAQSRLWLVGGGLAAVAISLVSAYAERGKDPFPVPAKQTIPFHAALDTVKLAPTKVEAEKGEHVPIGVPLSVSGIPQNSLGSIRGIRLVLEGPNGSHWDGLASRGEQLLVPGDNHWIVAFEMDYETYQRLKSVPLKAHVSLSVDVFHDQGARTVTATPGEFEVPGVGRCRLWRINQQTLRCSSPLVSAPMTVVRSDPALSTCAVITEPLTEPMDGMLYEPLDGMPYAWWPGRPADWPEGGVSPVAESIFGFWAFDKYARVCPGTTLIFSFPQFTENVRSDFEIENFKIDDYRRASSTPGEIRKANGLRAGLPPPPR